MSSPSSWTSHDPGYTSPHPQNDSFGSRQPPRFLTQRTARPTTIETEYSQSEPSPSPPSTLSPSQSTTLSPQSETYSPGTMNAPPIPPRQPPPLPFRPGNDGLRPPPRDAHETPRPTQAFPLHLQPSNTMPMPFQFPPRSPVSPSTLTPPRVSFPGGIMGGSAVPPSPQHTPSISYSHQSTTGYANRFGTMPSAQLDSGILPYEPPDISGGICVDVWPIYNEISQQFDEKRLSKWDKDLESLLLFAALFSAIVTSFLIQALNNLGPNYQQQSALLLYQLLNGRDPSLASLSDPTAPFEPSNLAIAANCLWFASLAASLGASFGAIICKEWLTEYDGGASAILALPRACQRQLRFTAFQDWNVHTFISLLPPILHSSVLLFFVGLVVFLWQIDFRVASVYLAVGGVFVVKYLILAVLPIVKDAPFRPYSTRLIHGLLIAIWTVIRWSAGVLQHGGILALGFAGDAILWSFARCILGKGFVEALCASDQPPPKSAKDPSDSLKKIDISQRIQEEAIVWLSQRPLDSDGSRVVVSSLALISRPHRFPKSVVEFLSSTLESEVSNQEHPGVAINCLLALGHIKYQSVVDQNWDHDHNVAGVHVNPLVVWGAQQLTTNALKFTFPNYEWMQTRLLMAAAWLSPESATKEVTPDERELDIKDRGEFIEKLKATFADHIHRDDPPVDNEALINLIHGMHACIPRGNYGSPSSIVSFLPLVCADCDSPWSEDESVLRALITYALDLLLPSTRKKPLVEREIGFEKLASELIDILLAGTASADVVAFGFWLIYRVLYAFKSRKSILADIVHIWASTNANLEISQDSRQLVSFHAIYAFVAVVQYHPSAGRSLPRLATPNTLDLLNAALHDVEARPMATHAVAMILHLGSSTQAESFTREADAKSFMDTLLPAGRDLEKNPTGEAIVDGLHIYSALVLLKLRHHQVDVEKLKELIQEVEGKIEGLVAGGSEPARDSKADINVDLHREGWEAIYLCGLLIELLPPGEREGPIKSVRGKVLALCQGGELLSAVDYKNCIKPLGIGALEPRVPGQAYSVFEAWNKGFPSLPLVGSVYVKK